MDSKTNSHYNKPEIQKSNFNYAPLELSDKYKRFKENQKNSQKNPEKPNIEKRVWDSDNFEWKTSN